MLIIFSLNSFQKEKNQDYGRKENIIMTFANSLDKIMEADAVSIPFGIFGDNLIIQHMFPKMS